MGGRQQGKLIITSVLIFVCRTTSVAQTKYVDTTAFKKEFEVLLAKYGLSPEKYLINVTSNNQQGGQTALIINNNYFLDNLIDSINVDFKIIDDTTGQYLLAYPKKGSWTKPFVLTSVERMKAGRFFDFEGFFSSIEGGSTEIDGKKYETYGYTLQAACTKVSPLKIVLMKSNPPEFFIFGDLANMNRIYIYQNKKVKWRPAPENAASRLETK